MFNSPSRVWAGTWLTFSLCLSLKPLSGLPPTQSLPMCCWKIDWEPLSLLRYSNPFYFSVLSRILSEEISATSIWTNHLKLNISITSNIKQKQKHSLKVNNFKRNLSEPYANVLYFQWWLLRNLVVLVYKSRLPISVASRNFPGIQFS